MNPEKIVNMNNSINAVVQELLNEIAEMKRKISELEQNIPKEESVVTLNQQQIEVVVDGLIENIDYSEIASRVSLRGIAREIDFNEVASELDTNEIAMCIDTDDIASEVLSNIDVEDMVSEKIKDEMPDMEDAVAQAVKEHLEDFDEDEIKSQVLNALVESFFGGYASMQMALMKEQKQRLNEPKEVTA